MKSFKSTAWILPQPVLIIGTYNKNGKPNALLFRPDKINEYEEIKQRNGCHLRF